MRTNLGTSYQFRSSFGGGRNSMRLRNAYRKSLRTRTARSSSSDTSSVLGKSYFRGTSLSGSRTSRYSSMLQDVKNIKIKNSISLTDTDKVSVKKYENKAVENFKVISGALKSLNGNLPKWLEEAGVPKDVKFDFDYNIDAQKAEVTKISDEQYRETVETVLNKKMGRETLYTAFASRIMNGYISSAYYPAAAKSLEACFGQDIGDLSLDKNGNILGANANLQRAIKAAKSGKEYTSISSRKFPADDIEGVLKRLLSDKKITPNISHMSYDGNSICTNDGKFKMGKSFDASFFNDSHYVMRGAIALPTEYDYDGWIKNEKMF